MRICLISALAMLCFSTTYAADDWSRRAAAKVEALINDKDKEDVAASILDNTHPTGSKAKLASITTSKSLDDNSVSAVLTITWKGGLTGAGYSTDVTWKFNHQGHVEAFISHDNALIPSTKQKALDRYFETLFKSLFPKSGR